MARPAAAVMSVILVFRNRARRARWTHSAASSRCGEPGFPVARQLMSFDRLRQGRAGKLATIEAANRDVTTAGQIGTSIRETMMPHVFGRFYERATG